MGRQHLTNIFNETLGGNDSDREQRILGLILTGREAMLVCTLGEVDRRN